MDEISWAPSWTQDPPLDRANILGMNDGELLAYARDLQAQYRSLRMLWSATIEMVISSRHQLDRASTIIATQRNQFRAQVPKPTTKAQP